MAYLLDTDILVDFFRDLPGAAEYIDSLSAWSYSVVTALELYAGARNREETTEIDLFLAAYREIPLTQVIGSLARSLVRQYAVSHGIDPLDALIAATALHDGLTLATNNERHFKMVSGLKLEVPRYR